MGWILIILGLLYMILLIWNVSTDFKDEKFFSALLLAISAIIFVAVFSSYEDRNTPTAKNVYEGKTTLEITYKDSIPIDTIVVLKSEFINK